MYSDGWLKRDGHVVLSGGDAGTLIIRALVLPSAEQRLEVVVNGQSMLSEPVAEGLLDLAIPVPESLHPRHVALRWSATARIGPRDPREAAALLKFIEVASSRAPTSIRLPGSLGVLGLEYSGIYRDGWSEKHAHVVLAGGEAGQLVIRAQIPDIADQRLDVRLDGRSVASESVTAGPLDLRIPVPASEASRRVELAWASEASTSPDDPRPVAALLRFIGVSTGVAPATVRIPEDLSDPTVTSFGITEDGWAESLAGVVLAGGPAGELVIRAHIPAKDQRLNVQLDGRVLASESVAPGELDLRLPVPASDADRRVELAWAVAAPLSEGDARVGSALLKSLGVAAGPRPKAAYLPAALDDPGLEHGGIYADGWMEQVAWVVLAGGPAATLFIRCQVPAAPEVTRLEVAVNGEIVESRTVSAGSLELRIAIAEASSDRRVELHWSSTARVGPEDPREAAALLLSVAIAPRTAS